MKGTQPNSHCRQTNRIVETCDPKLNFWNFIQVVWKFNWQSMPTNLTPKIWYVGAIRVNKPIQKEKNQHFNLNNTINSVTIHK